MRAANLEHEFQGDPFFEIVHDGEWNATLGRQGHQENYLDGYIEAAIELADAVITKKLYEKRDTLILPILYNARHATELNIKFAYDRLVKSGAIVDTGRALDHNISVYWKILHDSNVGDAKLRHIIASLEVFVVSLARIDTDGQELRYHRNRNDDLSLEKFSIVNLVLVQESLRRLQEILLRLKYRILEYANERTTGTFTRTCSRHNLKTIAGMLLPRNRWTELVFDEVKVSVREQFGLSGNEFSSVCKTIEKTRELAALIGIESPLLYITDDEVRRVIEQWRKLHPKRNSDQSTGLDYFDISRFEGMEERHNLELEVIEAVVEQLDTGKIADLEVMFYLERDCHFSEDYEEMVKRKIEEYDAANDIRAEVRNLLEKTSLLHQVRGSAVKLGRITLAAALSDM